MKNSNEQPALNLEVNDSEGFDFRSSAAGWVSLFERLFAPEMKLLRAAGVHPLHRTELRNPFTGEVSAEDFRNIGQHCIAVAAAARVLARHLVEAGHLSPKVFHSVAVRALLHDIAKPFEIFWLRSGGDPSDMARPHAELVRHLQTCNIPSYLVQKVLTPGREAGHVNFRGFLERKDSTATAVRLVSDRRVEKLVHLSDGLTLSSVPDPAGRSFTRFVTPSFRADECRHRYPFLERGGIALTTDGELIDVAELRSFIPQSSVVGSYVEVQASLSEQICTELRGLLVPNTTCTVEEDCRFVLRLLRMGLEHPR